MKRSPLARRTPLRSGGSLLRRTLAKVRRGDTGPTRSTREIVHERSGWVCERCGAAKAVQIHHRRPRRSGGSKLPDTNSPANLLDFCRGCHGWVESNRMEALLQGLLLHSTEVPREVPVLLRHGLVLLTHGGGVEHV